MQASFEELLSAAMEPRTRARLPRVMSQARGLNHCLFVNINHQNDLHIFHCTLAVEHNGYCTCSFQMLRLVYVIMK